MSEIEILEKYINENFNSKSSFAKALGMTAQNLNHHIRQAKKNENIFSDDFKAKLEFNTFWIFKKYEGDFMGRKRNMAAEPEATYSTAKDLQIEKLKMQVSDLRLLVKTLTERLKDEANKIKHRNSA